MDPLDLLKQLEKPATPATPAEADAPPEVKKEVPDEEEVAEQMDEMPSGMAVMDVELRQAVDKDKEATQRMTDFMMREEKEPPAKKKKGAKDDEKRNESRAELSTFGFSSRPRRSVNYANIERGDEAQAQSLVTEFTGKKRPKRTRDELDGNYEEGEDNRRRKVRPGHRNQFGSTSNSTMVNGRSNIDFKRTAMEEYSAIIPKPEDERPHNDSRQLGAILERSPAILRASGGFRRFVMWFSDRAAMQLITTVQRRCVLSDEDTQKQKVLRSLRHAYNTMPASYRLGWEKAAKMAVFESRGIINLAMPLSEIPVKDVTKERLLTRANGVRANCCSARPLMANMMEAMEHYLQYHDVVHFFGCDICRKIFPSRYELTKHECKEFQDVLYQMCMDGKTLELHVAYMYLCCSQCGLWLPLKATTNHMKGWTYFATSLMCHSCKPLVPIVVYFRNAFPEEEKNVRMNLSVIPHLDVTLQLSCKECGIEEFDSYAAVEEHFLAKHEGHTCSKCKKTFGTKFTYRHHQQTHMSSSAQFSNYLLYSATYEPPPGSGRVRHIGAGSEIPVSGGLEASELQVLELWQNKENGFVEPTDDTYRKKMWLYREKKNKKKENRANGSTRRDRDDSSGEEQHGHESMSSRDSDNDDVTSNARKKKEKPLIKKYKPDLGYEHVNKELMFEKSESERECRKRMDKLFNTKCLMPHERLLKPEETLEILREAEATELPALGCSLTEEIATALTKPLTLPAANCIDPLKDYVLINKIFNYCKKCNTVVSRDILTHSTECGAEEDQITELYNGASGPHAGVRCIFQDCKIHLCSVVALRFHLINAHDHDINIGPVVDTTRGAEEFTAQRYDKSLMNIAKRYQQIQQDERSWLAKMTDMDCFMPFGGILELKPLSQLARQVVAAPPPHRRVALSGPSFAAEQTMRPIAQRNQNRPYLQPVQPQPQPPTLYHNLPHKTVIKPFRVPRTNRWYSCSWCDREYETLDPFVDHLVKVHCHTCTSCGKCFATLNQKRAHPCTHSFDTMRRLEASLSGHCPTCSECFSVENIYVHMLRRHFSTIEFVTDYGEMIPVPRDISFRSNAQMVPATRQPPAGFVHTPAPVVVDISYDRSNNHEERMNLIKPQNPQVWGVDKRLVPQRAPPTASVTICPPNPENIDTRLMCYMCEMTFGDNEELGAHLDEHVEKWAHCPFCNQQVDGHYDMQKHLLTRHVLNITGRLCCQFCLETHRYMASHILYRCRKVTRCSICAQKSVDSLTNRGHMQRTHAIALRRFGCLYCPKIFASVSEYYEHECPAGGGLLFACSCSPDKFFAHPSAFCDHFDSLHIQRGRCKLCHFETQSTDAMVKHRIKKHMITEPGNDASRKLYVLFRAMFPRDDGSYMQFVNGGPKPSSYENVDRSDELYMMGDLGKIPIASLKTYSSPPPTLFDALNLGQRSPVQRNSPPLPRLNLPSTSNAAIPEIVLSDDEDAVVFVESGNSNKEKTPEPSNVDHQVSVRVEEAQEGYNERRNEPGYVAEDDDVEVAATDGTKSGQPIVKEVVDDNGDDELAVVAEVENTAGTLPSNVSAGREKTFRCTKCSDKFYTNAALKNHLEKSHKQDAGDTTCKETYGLPVETAVAFICRNCSIAFESREKHAEHMATHGNTSNSCHACSGIGFNQTSLQAHMQAHQEGRVNYACGTCLFQFPSDLALMDHLFMAHQISLFYFCKLCGFGSTRADTVFGHMNSHNESPWSYIQRFGACPAVLLNYNPADEKDFVLKMKLKLIEVHKPSDCSHRNMLVANDTVVSCKTCHCLQALFSYCANNGYGNGDEKPMPAFKPMNPQDNKFPLWRHLEDKNAEWMVKLGNNVMPAANKHVPYQPATSAFIRNATVPRQAVGAAAPNHTNHITVQRGSGGRAPVVSMTANGARAIYPVQSAAPFNHQQQQQQQQHHQQVQQQRITNMPTLLGQNRRVQPNNMRNPNQFNGAPPPMLPPQQRPVVRTANPVSTVCNHPGCEQVYTNDFDRYLHAMHTKDGSWLCRMCGITFQTEQPLFIHYVQRHLTPCYEKHVHEGFKSNVFKIRCPIPSCKNLEFASTLLFSKHMRKNHINELPFEAECCETRFATNEHCERHQRQHAEFAIQNGTDGACCALCGTQDIWSNDKDQKIDCLLSHTLRHGLEYRSSCRVCLKQFPSDTNQLLAVEHARMVHAAKAPNNTIHCKVCNKGNFSEYAFAEHYKKVHVFHLLCKAHSSVKGELVVTAGEEYERYVGLMSQDKKLFPRRSQAINQPSTSNATATVEIRENVGGNVALSNIAEAIGEPVRRNHVMDGEIMTID